MTARWVQREQWGARKPRASEFVYRTDPIAGVTVHHTTGVTLGAEWSDDWCRNIQAYHMDRLDYADIAYNALIDYTGAIHVGRPNNVVGAHSASVGNVANRFTLGVALLGDHRAEPPTDAALDALQAYVYVASLGAGYGLPVFVHKIWRPTECPGNAAIAAVIERFRYEAA